jgi:hypothetical protein
MKKRINGFVNGLLTSPLWEADHFTTRMGEHQSVERGVSETVRNRPRFPEKWYFSPLRWGAVPTAIPVMWFLWWCSKVMLAEGDFLSKRYCVIRPLGTGGFGTTYLVEDQRLKKAVFCT